MTTLQPPGAGTALPPPLTPPGPPPLSVVIVALDEAARLPALLADLASGWGLVREVLVVDGGSQDATRAVARLGGARLLGSPGGAGRGSQLLTGIEASQAPWLLLLHADVRLPSGWPVLVAEALEAGPDLAWAFGLAIEGSDPSLRLVEAAVQLRSRWRQEPYGDQGLLLHRDLHRRCGGMAPLPLMEDLEFITRLRRHARVRLLAARLRVDGRRWRRLGVWQTTLRNARLRRAWRRGVSAAELAVLYREGTQGAYQKAQRRSNGSSSQPRAS